MKKKKCNSFFQPGESDILVLDKETGQVMKKIELSGIIKDMAMSKCRFLHFDGRKFFIVDLGLNCIYVMSHETIVSAPKVSIKLTLA